MTRLWSSSGREQERLRRSPRPARLATGGFIIRDNSSIVLFVQAFHRRDNERSVFAENDHWREKVEGVDLFRLGIVSLLSWFFLYLLNGKNAFRLAIVIRCFQLLD